MMRIMMAKRRLNRGVPQKIWVRLIMLVVFMLSGCDLPDRHDIAILRRPAVWEIESNSVGDPDGDAQLSSVSTTVGQGKTPAAWEYWYLHHLDSVWGQAGSHPDLAANVSAHGQEQESAPWIHPRSITGGVMMRSELVEDSSFSSDSMIKVTLNERALVPLRSVKPQKFLTPKVEADPRADHAFYLSTNEQTFWHSLDGSLLRAECSVRRGPLQTNQFIIVSGDSVSIETNDAVGIVKKKLAAPLPLGGPLAVYQTLIQNPLIDGEVREVAVLLPTHEAVATLRLRGNPRVLAKRLTEDGIQLKSLNEAVGLIATGDSRHRERYYWYDDNGVIETTNIVGEPSFAFRCTEQQFENWGTAFLERSNPIGVSVDGKAIPMGNRFENLSHIAFDVECVHPGTAKVLVEDLRIPPAPRQYVQELDGQRQRVIIARQPVSKSKLGTRFESFDMSPDPADLAPSALIDYRAGSMRGVLSTVASLRQLSKPEQAAEINRTVHSLLTYRSAAKGFQPASQVAMSAVADSTEHAILLMAMLRANGIPARMALGLRLDQSSQDTSRDTVLSSANQFGYHAWVLANVDGEWISLDPTTGLPTTIDCIALQTTNLKDADVNRLVNRMLGQLRLFRLSVHRMIVAKK